MFLTSKQLRDHANILRKAGFSDADVLKHLDTFAAPSLERRHEATQERVAIIRQLSELSEAGKIAIVESGMDCDCVAYTGNVRTCSSDSASFWETVNKMYENAEGPISWYLARPSEARNIKSTSRDLAFEAYEDGHPHVVFY
jgi:hypothetical protein